MRDSVRESLLNLNTFFSREIDIDKAKEEVLGFVRACQNVYADEIASKLDLDVETVILPIEALIKENRLTEAK